MRTILVPLRRSIRLEEANDYNIDEYDYWAQIHERPAHDALTTQADVDKHIGDYLDMLQAIQASDDEIDKAKKDGITPEEYVKSKAKTDGVRSKTDGVSIVIFSLLFLLGIIGLYGGFFIQNPYIQALLTVLTFVAPYPFVLVFLLLGMILPFHLVGRLLI